MHLLTDKEIEFCSGFTLREISPEEIEILKEFEESAILAYSFSSKNIETENNLKTTDFIQKESEDFEENFDNSQINIQDSLKSMHFVVNEIFLTDENDDTSQIIDEELLQSEFDQKNLNISIKANPKRERHFGKIVQRKKSIAKFCRPKINMNSETKNIPKNYGKQVISFIKKERNLTKRVLESTRSPYTPEQMNSDLKKKKKGLNRIDDLKKLWTEGHFCKEVRIMTDIFLRKYSLKWIFNSRLENIKFPIKYRNRMIEGVKKPEEFSYLKDF